MTAYTVRYERDDSGWWVATVKGVRGCHTQGKSIGQARKRIREALSLFVHDANSAEFVEQVIPPPPAKPLLQAVIDARRRAEREEENVRNFTAQAARVLTKQMGVSLRDAGELLGLSYQRVQQLVPAKPQRKVRKITRG